MADGNGAVCGKIVVDCYGEDGRRLSISELLYKSNLELMAARGTQDITDEDLAVCMGLADAYLGLALTMPIQTWKDARAALEWMMSDLVEVNGEDLPERTGAHTHFLAGIRQLIDNERAYETQRELDRMRIASQSKQAV